MSKNYNQFKKWWDENRVGHGELNRMYAWEVWEASSEENNTLWRSFELDPPEVGREIIYCSPTNEWRHESVSITESNIGDTEFFGAKWIYEPKNVRI